MNAPVLFARIGWMVYYAGPQSGDERPKGGGRYNNKCIGHEAFNFARFNDRLFGFVQPPMAAKDASIALERISPNSRVGSISGVLLIFVATDREHGGQRVVGWYRNATVYRERQPYPSDVAEDINEKLKFSTLLFEPFTDFYAEADARKATLLPTRYRTFLVPKEKGIGQANVCYVLGRDGRPNGAEWISRAVEFVESYAKENLLQEPDSEANVEESVVSTLERAAGFQSNPAIRKAIEELAMEEAERYLEEQQYTHIKNTSKNESYDFTCQKQGSMFYVEVKGTQTAGDAVFLTKNEKQHGHRNAKNLILFVLHDIRVTGPHKPKAVGGVRRVLDPWDIEQGEWKPSGWTYRLPA